MINTFLKINKKDKDGNIILLKNKIKKRKTFIKICIKIIKPIFAGNYIIEIIKIFGDYNIFNLKDKEYYCVSNNMLIKCDEKTWDDYLKYINLNKNFKTIDENENLDYSLKSESDSENLDSTIVDNNNKSLDYKLQDNIFVIEEKEIKKRI